MPEDPRSPAEKPPGKPTGRNQPRPHPEDEPTGRDIKNTGRLLSVSDAADVLGITTDAVRGRIKRGTMRSERRNGSVFVWVEEADQPPPGRGASRLSDDQPDGQAELVEVLREQVEYLQDQLGQERRARTEERRRQDGIIAGLTQRIPQLEAPSSDRPSETPPDGPQEAYSGGSSSGRGNVPGSPGKPGEGNTERPSLWRRIFGVYPPGGSG